MIHLVTIITYRYVLYYYYYAVHIHQITDGPDWPARSDSVVNIFHCNHS